MKQTFEHATFDTPDEVREACEVHAAGDLDARRDERSGR
jgi:hypothetical protein